MGRRFIQLEGQGLPLDAAGNPPVEFPIFLNGKTGTQKGSYTYDDASASEVRTAEERKKRQPWMDYEHQSLHKPPIEAPAAAFFKLDYREDGLYATDVKWRPRAASYLRAGEYAFTSPAFWQDEKTGRVLELINVALTNDPATHDARALTPLKAEAPSPDIDDPHSRGRLVAASSKVEINMSKAIMVALGCKDDADESAGIAAASQLSDFKREVIALTGKATLAEAVAVVSALRQSAAEATELRKQVTQLTAEREEAAFGDVLRRAELDGRIPPQGDHPRRRYALSLKGKAASIEQLSAYVETLDPLVSKGGAVQPKVEADGGNFEKQALSSWNGRDRQNLKFFSSALGMKPSELAKATLAATAPKPALARDSFEALDLDEEI